MPCGLGLRHHLLCCSYGQLGDWTPGAAARPAAALSAGHRFSCTWQRELRIAGTHISLLTCDGVLRWDAWAGMFLALLAGRCLPSACSAPGSPASPADTSQLSRSPG